MAHLQVFAAGCRRPLVACDGLHGQSWCLPVPQGAWLLRLAFAQRRWGALAWEQQPFPGVRVLPLAAVQAKDWRLACLSGRTRRTLLRQAWDPQLLLLPLLLQPLLPELLLPELLLSELLLPELLLQLQ